MLIKTKNILCETKEIFNTWTLPSGPLDTSGDILWSSIVYIKNTGEIWTHGILLGGTLANATADKVDITLNNISKSISLHGHVQPYTTLTGSTTEANQAILSSGVKDKWILKTLGKNAFSNDDFLLANATAESAKRVVNDFIVSVKRESFISFNGSEAKTLNFIPGQNVSILSNSSGDLTISADAGDDTTNTAGAVNKEDTKLFLIGAESQTPSPQTYSNQFVYIGADNNLYSNGSKVWSSGNDGSESGLDADTVDGVHNGDLTSSIWKANRLGNTADLNDYNGPNYYGKAFYIGGGEQTTNKPSRIEAYGLLVLRSAEGHTTQLLSSTNTSRGLYWRGGTNSNLGSWNKIAFITDNVASASKLSPGCKIWGKAFTGESDIAGDMQEVGDIHMRFANYIWSRLYNSTEEVKLMALTNTTSDFFLGTLDLVNNSINTYIYGHSISFRTGGNSNTVHINNNGNTGFGTSDPQAKLHVVGNAKIEGEIYSNTNKVWHGGNDGSGSGLDADKLDGKHLSVKGTYFDRIPYVGSDGVIELGKYVDFHYTSTDKSDYSIRLNVPNVSGISITLPSKAGTLALVGDQVSSAGYAKKLYKIDSTNRTWTTAADLVGNGIVEYSDKTTNGRWTDYASIFQFSNQNNPDPGTSSHWVTQLWSSTSNKLGVRWRTDTGSWSSMQTILTDGNYTSYVKKIGTTDIGSTTQPIYLDGGIPTACKSSSSNTASTLAVRDGSGDIHCRLVRSTYDNQTVISGALAYRVSTSDNYIRFCSDIAAIRTWLQVSASNHTHNYINSRGILSPQTGRTQNLGNVYSYNTNSTTTGAPTTYTAVIGFGRGVSGTVEIAGGWTSSMGLWYRALRDTTDSWYAWRKIWDSGNDGSGSGLDADLLDGLHGSSYAKTNQNPKVDLDTVNGFGIMCNPLNAEATTARHYPIAEAGTLFYGTAAYSSANQIYGSYNSNRWFARGGGSSPTAKKSWREFAFTNSNVASASKLATKRTIWGKEFDGTANITGSLNSVADITMNGQLKIYASSSDTTHQLNLQSESTYNKIQSNGSIPLAINPDGNNVAIGATTASYKLWVNGTTAGTALYATSGYVYCNKGWFQNDTAGTGLYNKAQNARWQANGGVWNADKPIISSGYIKSTVATGTAPIQVASTTKCPNLNADLLDGLHGGRNGSYVLSINLGEIPSYGFAVVGLVNLTNPSSNTSQRSLSIGEVGTYRDNAVGGINNTITFAIQRKYNSTDMIGTYYWIGSATYLKPVTFTYKGVKYGGFALKLQDANGVVRAQLRFGDIQPFMVTYKKIQSGTTTVVNSEINNSLVEISSLDNKIHAQTESASKLGTSTVGNGTKPIYLSSGTPTASSSTVGSASVPVYLKSGTITKCTDTSLFSTLSSSSSTNLSVTIAGKNRTITDLYAYKADQLTTSRTLWGKSFNGSANVSGDMTSVGNITMSGGTIYNCAGIRDSRATTADTQFYKWWANSKYSKLVFSTTSSTNSNGFIPGIQLASGSSGFQVMVHAEQSSYKTYCWIGYSTVRQAKALETTGYLYAPRVYANGTQLTSDIRLKNRISTYKCDLYDKLKNITPFYYTRKGEENQICLGFSANEINHAFPEFIDKQQDLNNKYCQHYYTVDFATFGSLVAVMGYKELYRKNLEQIKKTDKIEKRVAKLTKKYRELKKLVDQLLLNNE